MSRFGRHGRCGRIAHLIGAGMICLALGACANSNVTRNTLASTTAHDVAEQTDAGAAAVKGRESAKSTAVVEHHVHQTRDAGARARLGYSAVGMASWYGADFHGRRTADGETFDMNSFTAAHPTLPLPCRVRVTNLANRRSIVVRVNDRGPYVNHRLIDVSARTAKMLGFYAHGVAKVKIDYVGRAPAKNAAGPAPLIE